MASDNVAASSSGPQTTGHPRHSRRVILDIPDKFKDGEDAGEDVTAPKTKKGVGSNANFNARFSNDTGDDEVGFRRGLGTDYRQGTLPGYSQSVVKRRPVVDEGAPGLRVNLSERKMAGSVPNLSKRPARRKHLTSVDEQMSTSQILVPPSSQNRSTDLAPSKENPMDDVEPIEGARNLIAEDESQKRTTSNEALGDSALAEADRPLEERLAKVFGFENQEDVIAG